MRNIGTICGKDLRIYFTTWTSYIIIGAFLLMSAFFFQSLIIEFQRRSMEYMQMQAHSAMEQLNLTDWVMAPLFLNMTVFFLFMLPVITMRLLADEKRSKTMELLMTSPVRPIEIVLGKYAAALVVMASMLGLTVLFPILLYVYGQSSSGASPLDLTTVAISYLGMFLLGASFIAVGLLASSVTDSQMVAVILGFAALLMFYVIGLAGRGQEGLWQHLFTYLSIHTHLEGFVRGIIRTPDLMYYASLTFFSLFLTYRVVEAQRWT